MSCKEQVIEVDTLPVNIEQGGVYSIGQANPNSYTHGMFKYPCKFIPEIPRWAVRAYLSGREGVVFDPFAGSGTALLEANLNGYDSIGAEIDDIARLIIKVKTTRLNRKQMEMLDGEFERIAGSLDQEKIIAYRPAIENLEHWFSGEAVICLGRLRTAIEQTPDRDVRDFFRVCMISIIKRVSNADDTSPKPYVSGKIIKNPPTVQKEFSSVFKRYREMIAALNEVPSMGSCRILEGDALSFQLSERIDLAITSPPYINAFDYGRTMRLENLWMGVLTEEELRLKKERYVGTEKINAEKEKASLEILSDSALLRTYYKEIGAVDEKRALIVKKFFEDIKRNLEKVFVSLKTGGRYVIVIGNSAIRKVNVESWRVIGEIGSSIGYDIVQSYSYVIRNPYIRIPRQGMGGKIARDHVLVLGKEKE